MDFLFSLPYLVSSMSPFLFHHALVNVGMPFSPVRFLITSYYITLQSLLIQLPNVDTSTVSYESGKRAGFLPNYLLEAWPRLFRLLLAWCLSSVPALSLIGALSLWHCESPLCSAPVQCVLPATEDISWGVLYCFYFWQVAFRLN